MQAEQRLEFPGGGADGMAHGPASRLYVVPTKVLVVLRTAVDAHTRADARVSLSACTCACSCSCARVHVMFMFMFMFMFMCIHVMCMSACMSYIHVLHITYTCGRPRASVARCSVPEKSKHKRMLHASNCSDSFKRSDVTLTRGQSVTPDTDVGPHLTPRSASDRGSASNRLLCAGVIFAREATACAAWPVRCMTHTPAFQVSSHDACSTSF